MRSVTRIPSGYVMLALAFALAGAAGLKGQDAVNLVVPPLIKFNGVMAPLGTQNRTSDSASARLVTATFSLYEFQEGGTPLWSETQKVQLDERGRYLVLLGTTSSAGLPVDLFTSGKALWLGVQPQSSGAGELPRVLLAPVPYALKASDSDTLGGKPASAYALAGSPAVVVTPEGSAPSPQVTNPTAPGNHVDVAVSKDSSPQPLAACSAVTSNGAATINAVAKFTAACTIQNSLLRDNGTGVAVGGIATPGALFDVQYTSTAATGSLLGQRVLTTLNPAAASSAITNGFFSNALTQSGNIQNFTGSIFALNSEFDHNGKGTLANGYGIDGTLVNKATGTITSAYGINAALSNTSTGKITTGYGVYVGAPVNSGGGTFSSYTGLYIANPTAVTGAYGLYSAGGKNYFAGDVGIGTPTPGANLEVNGTTKLDGLVTFKAGQTFPGAGTVTSVIGGAGLAGGTITSTGTLSISSAGVTNAMLANPSLTLTAGTDLTGGGAVALGNAVTLNLDTSKVPQLSGNNTFTGAAIFTSNAAFSGNGESTTIGNLGCLANSAGISFQGTNCTNYALIDYNGQTILNRPSGRGISFREANGGDQMTIASGGAVTIGGTLSATGSISGSSFFGSGSGLTNVATLTGTNTFTGANAFNHTPTFAGNGESAAIGNLGCAANSVGISFQGVNCTNYALIDYNGQTILNRMSGKSMSFRQANGSDQMTLAANGAVTMNSGTKIVTVSGNGTQTDYGNNGNGTFTILNYTTDNSTNMFLAFAPNNGGAFCYMDTSANFNCAGPSATTAAVNGGASHVTLYATQSPENWFEDYGSGSMVNGVATVTLEPVFAQTINTAMSYHVFLTPNGDCRGLFVTNKTATSFEVHELGGGHASIDFEYRVAGKRKGYENVRLVDQTERINRMKAREGNEAIPAEKQ